MGGSRVSRISSVALQSLHQAFKMICTYPTFLTDVEINMFPASLPSLKQHSIYHSAPRAHFPNSDNKKSPKPSEGKINPHPRLCKSPSTAMNKRRINPEKNGNSSSRGHGSARVRPEKWGRKQKRRSRILFAPICFSEVNYWKCLGGRGGSWLSRECLLHLVWNQWRGKGYLA